MSQFSSNAGSMTSSAAISSSKSESTTQSDDASFARALERLINRQKQRQMSTSESMDSLNSLAFQVSTAKNGLVDAVSFAQISKDAVSAIQSGVEEVVKIADRASRTDSKAANDVANQSIVEITRQIKSAIESAQYAGQSVFASVGFTVPLGDDFGVAKVDLGVVDPFTQSKAIGARLEPRKMSIEQLIESKTKEPVEVTAADPVAQPKKAAFLLNEGAEFSKTEFLLARTSAEKAALALDDVTRRVDASIAFMNGAMDKIASAEQQAEQFSSSMRRRLDTTDAVRSSLLNVADGFLSSANGLNAQSVSRETTMSLLVFEPSTYFQLEEAAAQSGAVDLSEELRRDAARQAALSAASSGLPAMPEFKTTAELYEEIKEPLPPAVAALQQRMAQRENPVVQNLEEMMDKAQQAKVERVVEKESTVALGGLSVSRKQAVIEREPVQARRDQQRDEQKLAQQVQQAQALVKQAALNKGADPATAASLAARERLV